MSTSYKLTPAKQSDPFTMVDGFDWVLYSWTSLAPHRVCAWLLVVLFVLIKLTSTIGIFKQAADVGTAMWSLAIALHTFSVLALQVEPTSKLTLFGTLIAGWSGICAIVICGPAVVNTAQRGPFCEFQFLFSA